MNLPKALKKTVRFALIGYAGLIALLYFTQEKMIFFPEPLPQDFKFKIKGHFVEKFVSSGKDQIHSLIFKVPQSKGLIIYFHGNGGAMDTWGETASELSAEFGWDVWMVDYPGYGKSTGRVQSQEQLLKMADDIFAQAQKEYPNAKIILYGRSLGTGVAVYVASHHKVAGLILETPYTSLSDIAKGRFPFLPLFFFRYPMLSNQWIKEVDIPILILHGTEDATVPFKLGQALSELAPNATFVAVPGGRHNDLSMFPEFNQAIRKYLSNY